MLHSALRRIAIRSKAATRGAALEVEDESAGAVGCSI